MNGATLDSWLSLADTKDISGSSLLRHLMKHIPDYDKDVLAFVDDVSTLDVASK